MEVEAYTLMASHEDGHWWFVGRRAVLGALLDRLQVPPAAQVLEAGCGTGGNIYMLERRGQVWAFDPHEEALAIARERHPTAVIESGELPNRLPYPPSSFDLVAALDVLEHVDDDRSAMECLVGAVRPGGHVIVTVPAHQLLWGSHDRRLHHRRRYSRRQLMSVCEVEDTVIEYMGAFNTVLAPIAIAVRLFEKVGIPVGNQERMPGSFINVLLGRLFAAEAHAVRRGRIPFGLSYVAILRRL